MNTKFKEIVSKMVPFIGSLLGGPLGEEAGSALSYLLTGDKNSSEENISAALQNATPSQIVALKQLDEQYQEKVLSVQLAEHQMDNEDIANARNRNIQLHDKMPIFLSIIVLTMFFSILLLFMLYPIQSSSKDIIQILIGSLAIWCGQAVNFYFGSTRGSQKKTDILSEKLNAK